MSSDRLTDTDESQSPQRRSFWQIMRHNFHWKCLTLTLVLDCCVTVILWCQLTTYVRPRQHHFERGQMYRNGDAVTTTQVYYERVNSHSAGAVFLYHECGVRDISKTVLDLEKFSLVKVRFSKGFVFANLQAANEFEDQRARFFQENEQRDDYMEVREGLDLLNVPYKEFMIAFVNPQSRPWYTRQIVFWLCSFFLCSWPLRIIIELNTAYIHYHVTKLFGTSYLSPSNANYTGILTRVDTMDSRELDAAMQANYVIVPSYSEALLMDPVNSSTRMRQDPQGHWHVARQRYRRVDSSEALCNEGVIPNYGSVIHEGLPVIYSRRSQSMSFVPPHDSTPPLDTNNRRRSVSSGRRSFSFGSLVSLARRGVYQALPTNSDAYWDADVPEEPPPPYELALKMCRPLYARIKRSITGESSKWKSMFSGGTSSGKGGGRDNNDPSNQNPDTSL